MTDITGVTLVPGEWGKHCPGNGAGQDTEGKPIECCCDECDYMLVYFPEFAKK